VSESDEGFCHLCGAPKIGGSIRHSPSCRSREYAEKPVKATLFEAWRAHHVCCPERFYGCHTCATLWACYVCEDWKQRSASNSSEAALRHEALERTSETALELKKLIRQLESDLDVSRKLSERRRQALRPFTIYPPNVLLRDVLLREAIEAREAYDTTEEKP